MMTESPQARKAKPLPAGRWPKWLAIRLPTQRSRRIFLASLILGSLVIVLLPAIGGFVTYKQAESLALDAVHHLDNIKAKVPSGVDISTVLSVDTLAGMQGDLTAASHDFNQLNSDLNSPLVGLAGIVPGIGVKIEAARHLAVIGIDITKLGSLMLQSGLIAASYVKASPMTATKPIITQANLDTIQQDLTQSAPLINDIAAQTRGVSFGSLLSSSQQALLSKFLTDLPQVRQGLASAQQFLQFAPTLLGLGKPSTFLMVTMDNSELRATGGFQGSYALVTMQDGHLSGSIKLNDTYTIDETNGQCWSASSSAPSQYSWWPYQCWGVRDSNISPDFPTTAKRAIDLLAAEKNWHVDGMIAITPTLIQQVIQLTGNIVMGAPYNVTITPQNLEAEIHYYQLVSSATALNSDLPPQDTNVSDFRKRFTGLLGNKLQARLHGVSTNVLGGIAKDAIGDIKTKDVELYFTDPKAEQFLTEQNVDASLYHGPNDALYVVDTNLSGKQSSFLQESFTDQVRLDASGGATHHLVVTYNFYNPNNLPTYGAKGFETIYRGYLRIYVPANSQRLSGTNFGLYDNVEPATTSDEPNRAMFAGWVQINMNAGPMTLTFNWYVPNAVPKGGRYSYVVQRQAGMGVTLSVTISGPSDSKPIATYATSKGQTLEKDVTITAP